MKEFIKKALSDGTDPSTKRVLSVLCFFLLVIIFLFDGCSGRTQTTYTAYFDAVIGLIAVLLGLATFENVKL